jgi:hypothetical protein
LAGIIACYRKGYRDFHAKQTSFPKKIQPPASRTAPPSGYTNGLQSENQPAPFISVAATNTTTIP